MMNSLNEVFDLPKDDNTKNIIVEVEQTNVIPVDTNNVDSIDVDFDKARESLHTIVKKGTKAVEDLEQLASLSQNAEHYAALATMIKNVSDVSKVLMGVHTEKTKNKRPTSSRVENHLHVNASTLEIAKMLKGETIKDD